MIPRLPNRNSLPAGRPRLSGPAWARTIATAEPKAITLSPITDDCLDERQGRNPGGVGAQDTGTEADRNHEILGEQRGPLLVRKPSFGADQDPHRQSFELAQLRHRRA